MADGHINFPLRVQTEDEDFVIERDDDDLSSPPDSVTHAELHDGSGDKVRLKRRRRCGQCGPCQVKENCGKCHFCLRKDVLKQTCIYRKCVYLRSKPKPYSRPKENNHQTSPQALPASQHVSPPVLRPPSMSASSTVNVTFTDNALAGSRPDNINMFMHSQRPEQTPMSPFHAPYPPQMDLALRHPFSGHPPSAVNMNMNPHCMVPSTRVSIAGDPTGVVPCSQQTAVSPIGLNDRSIDIKHPQPMQMAHPHTHGLRESSLMSEPARLPGYAFPGLGDMRSAGTSACMYGHTLPHTMPGPFDRAPGPHFLPTPQDMLRPQFFPPLPPGYPYPSNRFPDAFPGGPFPPLAMPVAPNLQACPPGNAQSFPQQFTTNTCNQTNGCPKNGCTPPASQNCDSYNAAVLQESIGKFQRSNSVPTFQDHPLGFSHSTRWKRPNSSLSLDDMSKSSDFQCDVIGIDDFQINAYIRSDGCNSLEIEIDDRSDVSDRCSRFSKSSTESRESESWSEKGSPSRTERATQKKPKSTVDGMVSLQQDLGEEGVLQLLIPGHKVTIEETVLDSRLARCSCNIKELLDFIQKEPKLEYMGRE